MTETKEIKDDKDLKKEEDWMQKKWRPMMALMYMTVCFFDFVIFPIMFTVVQFWEVESVNDAFRQWQPLTLSGAGLFHMAMGAVLGITAWSRGQEKMAGMTGGSQNPLPGMSNSTEPPISRTPNLSTSSPQRPNNKDRHYREPLNYNEPTFNDMPVIQETVTPGPGGRRRVTPSL